MIYYVKRILKWYSFYFEGIAAYNKILILLLTLGMGVWLVVRVKQKYLTYLKAIIMELLFGYLLFVLMSTVFARERIDTPQVNIDIVETYRYRLKYNIDTKYELLLNILLLLPFGTLFPYLVKRKKLLLTLFCGSLLSVLIESLQFVLKKGTLELTDIVNNSFGVLLGYLIFILVRRCRRVMKRTRNKKENCHV